MAISVWRQVLTLPVIVIAMGYFVDIYDLILFGVVRVESLSELGLDKEGITLWGSYILNAQMAGMLIGGILWGILGDKKGRLSVLFASIILYSVANLLNAFVTNVEQYTILRFIAGIGLAGELGAGVTLVAEILPKELRGYGVMTIAAFGVLGVVAAKGVAGYFEWRNAYIIGGVLGFMLLALRFRVRESAMFEHNLSDDIKRGQFFALFTHKKLFTKYIKAIVIGMPLWYVVGILVMFSPEFATALSIQGEVTAGSALMYTYIGLSVGDLASGYLSQQMRSRKKAYTIFMALSLLSVIYYFTLQGASADAFYIAVFLLGVFCGYWALFITMAAEQFGTNIRATVATTVPNFVRGSVVPITSSFMLLKESMGVLGAAATVGSVVFVIALVALYYTRETFHEDLDYIEA
ncbi:major facilitator superfamily MFS_1 [Sulfuricurvum kujiense DSM 16994]|uniref:Major facilitator superfamily MFS_1 n=1 Tax=Sulfuricurvum kujiense (strain ATCC BAA-921 / DSM 16994 / JCM 11577 / YK-1) TaxID=709032 RepID=E4TXA4_SULKY|nr:MFS transporter [Sulfuricurvum kujiense]ADR32801.1 major facilitator superfamily MFS_1 [Sulfuricurvum kujiense DSM 16994]